MARRRTSPLPALAAGMVAGAAGTLAMDLLWFRRYRRGGGEDSFRHWEFSAGPKSYDDAGAPAQVGQRVVERVLPVELPPESAALMNNVTHWATGIGWGAGYGIAAAFTATTHPALGVALGPVAWVTSYVVLGLAKLYKPIWEYDAPTLAKDLSAHLVFGLATSSVFRALRR